MPPGRAGEAAARVSQVRRRTEACLQQLQWRQRLPPMSPYTMPSVEKAMARRLQVPTPMRCGGRGRHVTEDSNGDFMKVAPPAAAPFRRRAVSPPPAALRLRLHPKMVPGTPATTSAAAAAAGRAQSGLRVAGPWHHGAAAAASCTQQQAPTLRCASSTCFCRSAS